MTSSKCTVANLVETILKTESGAFALFMSFIWPCFVLASLMVADIDVKKNNCG